MKIDCAFLCGEKRSSSFLMRNATYLEDIETGKEYFVCSNCLKSISVHLHKDMFSVLRELKQSRRKAITTWYQMGAVAPSDYDRIERESIEIYAQKYLRTSTPTFGFWLNDSCIIADEPSQQILFERSIVKFSDIESYKVFDNAIEYDIQSPSSTMYNIETKHGLRRTIIGNMFAGTAGAVMGGLTANHSVSINEGQKKTYSEVEHNFQVTINLKSIAYGGSLVVKIGNDEPKLQLLINLLNKLIN